MSGIGFWGPYYAPKEEKDPLLQLEEEDDEMPTEIDESSGFHVLEIHAPTAGISFFAIALGLLAIGLAYGCYRRCCYAKIFGAVTGIQQQAPVMAQSSPPQPYGQAWGPSSAHGDIQPLLLWATLQNALARPATPALPALQAPLPTVRYSSRITTLPENAETATIESGTGTATPVASAPTSSGLPASYEAYL